MMAADTSKITVVCPTCGNKTEIPGEKKNTRIECPKCGSAFMAYEAVKCEKCGKFRHPRHQCRVCFPDSDLARQYRERQARELFGSLPEDIRAVLEFEAEMNARRTEEMTRRIDELENRISDLESEIEELKGEE